MQQDFLALMCRRGRTGVVQRLARSGVYVAVDNNMPLRTAAASGHTGIVRLLLGLPLYRGVNPAAGDNAALREAAGNGHADTVRLLLDLPAGRGVDPAAGNNAALLRACFEGHTAAVRLLLALPRSRGVDPGADGSYALLWAEASGYTGVVRLLLAPRAVPVPPAVLAALQGQTLARTAYTAARWDDGEQSRGRGRLVALRVLGRWHHRRARELAKCHAR